MAYVSYTYQDRWMDGEQVTASRMNDVISSIVKEEVEKKLQEYDLPKKPVVEVHKAEEMLEI